MDKKIKIKLQGVQATMLIPIRGRSMMAKRFLQLYQNEKDEEICNLLDFDFTQLDRALGEYGNLCYVARALANEKQIREFTDRFPEATIVNIGSGLDALFHRVDNGKITWYNLDLKAAIELRNQLIEEPERSHCIAKSVFDYSWFDEIQYEDNKGLLLIAAGVFHFQPPEQLKQLFIALAERFTNTELFFDINSSIGNEYTNQMMKASGNNNALLTFAVDDPKELEQWSDKIKLLDCLPYFKETPRYPELEEMTRLNMDRADTEGMCKLIRLGLG